MNPAILSLIALLVAIGLSMATKLNVGVLAMAFAWLIGTYAAAWKVEQVAAGFPSSLFLTLTGVTLLFALAESNGTLERLAHRAVGLARGRTRLIPIILFIVAFVLSSVGPGAITTVALLIPMAMAIATRAGVPRFLTALAVANGANAGNLSPISAIGIVANTKMAGVGLGGHEGKVWVANLLAHVLVMAGAYVLLGGWKLAPVAAGDGTGRTESFERQHWITMAVIAAWITGVIGFQLSVGLAAFLAASVLVLMAVADESLAMKRVPWGVIVMVCGVTVLIAVLEKTGGMELFTSMLARLAGPTTINGVVAFVTGLISSWSSTAGRGVADVPANGAGTGGEGRRRRSARRRAQHQRGFGHGRRVAVVNVRRALRGDGVGQHGGEDALPSAPRVGVVDERRWRGALPALRGPAGKGLNGASSATDGQGSAFP